MPPRFRDMEQPDIRRALADADDIRYMLWSTSVQPRFPRSGWLTGSIANIATAIRIGATPISEIRDAARLLEAGIEKAAGIVKSAREKRPKIGKEMKACLRQEPGEQTDRMAMLIISNALVFQSMLAGTPELEAVPSLAELETSLDTKKINPNTVLAAWEQITSVNYHPIFNVAVRLVKALCSDDKRVGKVLYHLRNTAQQLVDAEITQVHELAGIVFQKLITNRKFTKANYTLPESAALLCALVLPKLEGDIRDVKVADFACGTGALLNGAYQRLLYLHEQQENTGKAEDRERLRHLHRHMMENNLVGCDVMPNAVHITASIVASTQPSVEIGKTRIHCMKYGDKRRDGFYSIGALNLLRNPEGTIPLDILTETVGGQGDTETELSDEFRHGEFDFVIMNPPFTRSASKNNSSTQQNAIFGDHRNAKKMRQTLKAQKSALGNLHAGLGSHFADLAEQMLKPNGKMGFVLPIPALSSPSWEKVRNLWMEEYHDVLVVTIADYAAEDCAYSADTNNAECLVIATKGRAENTGRATFVCLHRRPRSELEAQEIAKEVSRLKDIHQIEKSIRGGNPLKVGDEIVGRAITAPLRQYYKTWAVTRVRDMSAAHAAYHLANGRLWLPRQIEPLSVDICAVKDIATIASRYTDVRGDDNKKAFDFVAGCPDTADYPGLWYVDGETQVAMVVSPDYHLLPRANAAAREQQLIRQSGRVHYNMFITLNANPLAVMFTEKDTIGINLVPSIIFENLMCEYAWTLWCNSSLGFLCHWMHSGKQQGARGILSRTDLQYLPTLDVRKLTEAQLATAERIFHELKEVKMLPFNEMHRDAARHTLDRRLLSEVLGFGEDTHPAVHTGIALLREKLSAEPSITGTKQDRVN